MFGDLIKGARPTGDEITARRWIYVPYDRLTASVGPLADADPQDVGLVFVESAAKAERRPYHKKKLALLLSNERHFALEQAKRGFRILYLAGEQSIADALVATRLPALVTTRPAERELRQDLEEARGKGLTIDEVPDPTWLTTSAEFASAYPAGPPYRMDAFYRRVRKRTGLLMKEGKPLGGKLSHDAENRKPWRNERPVPVRPSFAPDAITREVLELVERRFPTHFGSLAGFDLPTTAADAERVWKFARTELLPWFGPWEDAMSTAHPDLFHTRVSALVNLARLLPANLIADTAEDFARGDLSLASAEGFIRQLLGWREYMRHIHDVTDGFRTHGMAGAPNALGAPNPLPTAYWGTPSGMNCLDTVVAQVLADGYSHHITRLMVLSNIATLAGVQPRALADWFWFGYVDAYDWVVEPNVLAMSTFGDGGQTTTKPYISGAAYINRMSDYCTSCSLDAVTDACRDHGAYATADADGPEARRARTTARCCRSSATGCRAIRRDNSGAHRRTDQEEDAQEGTRGDQAKAHGADASQAGPRPDRERPVVGRIASLRYCPSAARADGSTKICTRNAPNAPNSTAIPVMSRRALLAGAERHARSAGW